MAEGQHQNHTLEEGDHDIVTPKKHTPNQSTTQRLWVLVLRWLNFLCGKIFKGSENVKQNLKCWTFFRAQFIYAGFEGKDALINWKTTLHILPNTYKELILKPQILNPLWTLIG